MLYSRATLTGSTASCSCRTGRASPRDQTTTRCGCGMLQPELCHDSHTYGNHIEFVDNGSNILANGQVINIPLQLPRPMLLKQVIVLLSVLVVLYRRDDYLIYTSSSSLSHRFSHRDLQHSHSMATFSSRVPATVDHGADKPHYYLQGPLERKGKEQVSEYSL